MEELRAVGGGRGGLYFPLSMSPGRHIQRAQSARVSARWGDIIANPRRSAIGGNIIANTRHLQGDVFDVSRESEEI